jgi:nitroimidazol reductase NimA-like FMN-containing flavoprotein (pyridoxamine 5'-phosphate oxidase superfamily)|tara:strand:- start:985 stop:1452 length:468 start_codon:yes stop_codon:yes gene_type:complete
MEECEMGDKAFIDSFLAEKRMCRFSVTRKGGGQIIRPIWYIWEDGKFLISTKTIGVHTRIVKRNPKISIVVDKDDPPYAAVVCEGDVELIEGVGTDHDLIGRCAERYLGPEIAPKFMAGPVAQVDRVRFIVHPKRWTIWNAGADPPFSARPGDYS